MKKFFTVLLCVFVLTALNACTIKVNGNRLDIDSKGGLLGTILTEEDVLLQSAADTQELVIDNMAGNINVVHTDGSEVKVRFTKKVRGSDEEKKNEVMDNIKIVADKDGKKLTVHATTRDGGESDLWRWIDRKYSAYNVTIDYELEVPGNMKVFTIRGNAGNIRLEEVTGSIDIRTNAGNVELAGVSFIDGNLIKLNAGNININGSVKDATELDVETNAGNIILLLPSEEKLDIHASVKVGNISGSMLSKSRTGSGSVSEEINGGGPLVKLELNAGNINVNSK